MKFAIAPLLALVVAAVALSSAARAATENDNNRDTHSAKQFYEKHDMDRT